ncbi:type II secretion system F family protein [Glycomyces sp. MUSA5-2]|uniref:type II secretion system F family protein n=1 Tax=Glycomyces sp. MUSA5-2 TaxID=2053002 RepID=UPI003007FF7D
MSTAALAIGALAGLGLFLAVSALWPRTEPDPLDPAAYWGLRARMWLRANVKRLLWALAAAVLVWIVTGGWIADVIGAAALAYFAPVVFGDAKQLKAAADRATAVASWTESIRSALTGSAGLEQAISAAAAFPPAGLETETADLAAAVRSGQRLDLALSDFRDRIDDATGDIVVYTLQRAWRRGGNLGDVLARLAAAARDRARMQQRVSAARAGNRTTLRQLTVAALCFALVLPLLNPIMRDALDTQWGQAFLFICDGLLAAAILMMVRLAAWERPPRLIAQEDRP